MIVSVSYKVLASVKTNLLYKKIGVVASVEQHLHTGEVRNAKFIEFLPYKLDKTEKMPPATDAFDDVSDPVEWVRSLRGAV